jgi:hypothetical protein
MGIMDLDARIQQLAQQATQPLPAEQLAEVSSTAEALVAQLDDTLAHDTWQWRTLVIALAQLREQGNDHLGAARAWVVVAAVASHRSDALPNARAAYLRAGAFDEWTEVTRSNAPRMAPVLEQARTASERSLILDTIPWLEHSFVGPTERPGVFAVQAITRETLEALVEAKHAPEAKAFLSAFPHEWTNPPLFDGLLALPPASPCGFFVSGVDAPMTGKGKALLARATSSSRRYDRVVATWDTPHGAGEPPEPPPPEPEPRTDFERLVKSVLRDHLDASGRALWRFADVPFALIETLRARLGEQVDSQGNACPPLSELLECTRSKAIATTFSGYVVWPPRADARVTVDAVSTPVEPPAPWRESADEVSRSGGLHHLWWD